MRKIVLVLSVLLCCNLFGDIPSQKDSLTKQYMAAKNNYTQAVRLNDAALFSQSVEDLKSLGQAIITANQPLVKWMSVYTSKSSHKNDIDMKSALTELQNANKNITLFSSPNGITPEGVRSVDAFITLLNKSISGHDAACQKVNMSHPPSTGGQATKAFVN